MNIDKTNKTKSWDSIFMHLKFFLNWYMCTRGRHGCDCMVIGFTTTCAFSACHH